MSDPRIDLFQRFQEVMRQKGLVFMDIRAGVVVADEAGLWPLVDVLFPERILATKPLKGDGEEEPAT